MHSIYENNICNLEWVKHIHTDFWPSDLNCIRLLETHSWRIVIFVSAKTKKALFLQFHKATNLIT